MSRDDDFADLLWRHVTGSEGENAVRSLKVYFRGSMIKGQRSHYSGRYFEERCDPQPDRFTANDFVAVSMLGVTIPAHAAQWILTDGAEQLSSLLHELGGSEVRIWDDGVEIGNPESKIGKAVCGLRDALRARPLIGRTKASKLLAAKRPHLVPIHDKYVAIALAIGDEDDRALWSSALSGPRGAKLLRVVEDLRSRAEVPTAVSVLRVLDIVVWMRHHGGQPKWANPDALGYKITDPLPPLESSASS